MSDLYIYQGFEDDHSFLRAFEPYAGRSQNKLVLTWSGMKAAADGNRVLIYDRTRKTLAIAATVEGNTYPSNDPEDWLFLTPLTNFHRR